VKQTSPIPWAQRIRARLADSPWVPVASKLGAYLVLFVALAAVGSGAAGALLPSIPGGQHLAALLQPAAAGVVFPVGPDAGVAPTGAEPPNPPVEPDASPPAGSDAAATPADASPEAGAGVTTDGKVILNLATEADLCRLPGIGPSKARAIVALRAKLGRLRRPEDLLRVRGIGRRSLARLRPLLTVD